MRRLIWTICSFFLLLEPLFAATQIVPTTTLNAETGKNTSAADSFPGSPNGNIAAGVNVSKVSTATLLYPGATTKIYAHLMPWFGFGNHYDIGYRSDNPAQVKAQVSDMLSRGITGMIIDWYGEGSNEDKVSLVVKPEAESRNGQFEFAIMEDAGSKALSGCSTGTAPDNLDSGSCTSGVIKDLTYTYNVYESSSAYMRWNSRPVVFFFGVEGLPVNWTTVRAQVPGNPILIFQNAGGFTRSYSDGGFSWVMPGDVTSLDPMAVNYLDDFYSTALAHSDHLPFATGYKGFDDTIADWSANRHMQQQCGQTWLKSMAEIGKYYSANRQLTAFQLVTWNDYEEGTEIETGIDNCLNIGAAVTGSIVSWSVSGNENTLDHYTVFISIDGQSLMSLGDLPTATHSLDLSTFGFAAGNYTIYVKAVGKPSIINHMSGLMSYTVAAPAPGPGPSPGPGPVPPATPDFAVLAPASTATVAKGNAANYTLSLIPSGGSSGSVVFACSGLPEGASCSFNPGSVSLGSAPVPVNVSISTSNGTNAGNHFTPLFFYAMTFPAFGTVLAGVVEIRKRKLLLVLLMSMLILMLAGCGGGSSPISNPVLLTTSTASAGTPSGMYTVTISATAGALQRSTTVSLTVQ